MALRDEQLGAIVDYLQGRTDRLSSDILRHLELGLWIFHPYPGSRFWLDLVPVPPEPLEEPLLLCGRFGPEQSLRILDLFRERQIPYLLVRVESWSCYLNCNGEILSEHCEEDLDAMREACERLRERCPYEHPPVRL